jgi:hypothetical protein
MMFFNRRIDLFGNRFAGESARDATNNGAGNGSDRSCCHTCGRSCGSAAECCTNARTDRMGTRFIRDRIAIFVTINIVTRRSHDKTSKGSERRELFAPLRKTNAKCIPELPTSQELAVGAGQPTSCRGANMIRVKGWIDLIRVR